MTVKPTLPGESLEEKKKRLEREKKARYRDRNRGPTVDNRGHVYGSDRGPIVDTNRGQPWTNRGPTVDNRGHALASRAAVLGSLSDLSETLEEKKRADLDRNDPVGTRDTPTDRNRGQDQLASERDRNEQIIREELEANVDLYQHASPDECERVIKLCERLCDFHDLQPDRRDIVVAAFEWLRADLQQTSAPTPAAALQRLVNAVRMQMRYWRTDAPLERQRRRMARAKAAAAEVKGIAQTPAAIEEQATRDLLEGEIQCCAENDPERVVWLNRLADYNRRKASARS